MFKGKLMRVRIAVLGVFTLLATAEVQARVAIVVDKNRQIMTVAVDGVERFQWPISSGKPSHETPNGQFRAFRMEEDHYSKEFDDAPMPHSIFFTRSGHAIHGTDWVDRLGSPASHGCVRLSRENATTLFALVQSEGVLNTTVELSGSSKVALATNARLRARAADGGGDTLSADEIAGNPTEQADRTIQAVGQRAQPQVGEGGYTEPSTRRPTKQHELPTRDRRRAADVRSRSSQAAPSPVGGSRNFFSFVD